MKRYSVLLFITFGYIGIAWPMFAQQPRMGVTKSRTLASSASRRDLAIEYSEAAKFKTASQNTKYRNGDLISVDVAILNASAVDVYSLRLDLFADLNVTDLSGKQVPIMLYGSPDFILRPQDYVLVKPGGSTFAHILLRVGCEGKNIPRFGSGRELFETNSFVNMGRGCIDFQKPGAYSIRASVLNSRVVIDKGKTIKTLTGTFESSPLSIIFALDTVGHTGAGCQSLSGVVDGVGQGVDGGVAERGGYSMTAHMNAAGATFLELVIQLTQRSLMRAR